MFAAVVADDDDAPCWSCTNFVVLVLAVENQYLTLPGLRLSSKLALC